MMSRGRLEYTGFQKPASWSAPSLAVLPVTHELLVVPDLQKDHRHAPRSAAPLLQLPPFLFALCTKRVCPVCARTNTVG
jgi:hypothetical protein